jgi:hypothetical protein
MSSGEARCLIINMASAFGRRGPDPDTPSPADIAKLSNTMEAEFCIEALKEALAKHGTPETFNTDLGSQFVSGASAPWFQDFGFSVMPSCK